MAFLSDDDARNAPQVGPKPKEPKYYPAPPNFFKGTERFTPLANGAVPEAQRLQVARSGRSGIAMPPGAVGGAPGYPVLMDSDGARSALQDALDAPLGGGSGVKVGPGTGYKGFRLGYPLGHTIPVKNEAVSEALLDYCYRTGQMHFPWSKHMRLLGSVRAESVRIDDNRNQICEMHLKRCEKDGGEVLIFLDRDEVYPPDGVIQLALACTPELPIVSGVYFQRSPNDAYPHVYRRSVRADNHWGEPSLHADKLVREVWEFLHKWAGPPEGWKDLAAVRFGQPNGSPLPDAVRLLRARPEDIEEAERDGIPVRHPFGATGLTAIHSSLLIAMREKGAPYYPWFRDRGEKGDVAFFHKAHELGYASAVDLSVYAGHLTETVVGLSDFIRVFAPACELGMAHVERTTIDRVAVVIPTLHPDRAGALLERVQETAGMPVLGVIVADYERRGGTRTLNDGVAAALNTGAPAVLLLDDDVEFPQQGWLRQLADALEAPHVGAVGPSLPCRGPQNGRPEPGLDAANMPLLCGACVLYKRAALEDVGQLDERMQHYASDTDHAFLLRNHGWRLQWVQDVQIGHEIAGNGFFPEQWAKDHAVLEQKWGLDKGSSTTPATTMDAPRVTAEPTRSAVLPAETPVDAPAETGALALVGAGAA